MINGYKFNERLVLVNGIALLTMIGCGLSLKSFRNTGVVYLASGIVFAPEIFNPFLKDSSKW